MTQADAAPGPGPGQDPDRPALTTDELDGLELVDDTITAGGSGPEAGGYLVHVDRRAQLAGDSGLAGDSEPNGWFAGPYPDPDRFELLGPGLSGGEGNTWRARYRGQLTSPLTLAVKELRRPPHAPPEWPTPDDVSRWEDQRALLQYMRIDHLVTVIDIFVGPPPHLPGPARRRVPETPYVVMEWVPGPTLADELSGRAATATSLDARLAHVQHVAEALHALHSRTASAGNPTLHRDVKPTNCILDPRRGVVLVDVGTMRRMDDGYDHAGFHTPAYTAPEVLQNPHAPRAASSDLYSLGALAYFCVLGEDPPKPDQPGAAGPIESRLIAGARAAGVRDVRGFVGQLRKMLDPSSAGRPADAMAWSRRLRTVADTRRGAGPFGVRLSTGRLSAGVIAVVVLALGVLAAIQLIGGDNGSAANLRGSALPTGATAPGPTSGAFSPPPGMPPCGPPPGGPTATGAATAGPGATALGWAAPGAHPCPPGGGPGPGGPGVAPPGARPDADGNITTDVAAIVSPAKGAVVHQCIMVRGTSKLPAGQTLLLAVENMSAGDQVRHLQPVQGWQHPEGLRKWQGRQFIGRPEDPPGGLYRIEVLTVPMSSMKQFDSRAQGPDFGITAPAGAFVMASLRVTRADAAGAPQAC